MRFPCPGRLTALATSLLLPAALLAQAAVDPGIAPRAAALAGSGQRGQATELLGRYLATAPDDAGAWLELGRFYLLDARDWHREGHIEESPASLFLDFAATALDQSLRLPSDSSRMLRSVVELERAVLDVERGGWTAFVANGAALRASYPPVFVLELGRNLVASCPLGGVLVTGNDVETVGVWTVTISGGERGDLVLLLPALYGEDSVYRARMATALEIQPVLPVDAALTEVAARRPVCLTPAVPASYAPHKALVTHRLLQVAGPAAAELPQPLSITELASAHLSQPNALTRAVLAEYQQAARRNRVLCVSLLSPFGERTRSACGD